MRSERNMSLKNPVTPPGIDPATIKIVISQILPNCGKSTQIHSTTLRFPHLSILYLPLSYPRHKTIGPSIVPHLTPKFSKPLMFISGSHVACIWNAAYVNTSMSLLITRPLIVHETRECFTFTNYLPPIPVVALSEVRV
jgi:hypothetical protein